MLPEAQHSFVDTIAKSRKEVSSDRETLDSTVDMRHNSKKDHSLLQQDSPTSQAQLALAAQLEKTRTALLHAIEENDTLRERVIELEALLYEANQELAHVTRHHHPSSPSP